MLWTEFTALLLLATAMSFTPGPNTALATAMAANAGLRHSLRFVLAVPVGWCLLLLLCSVGVGALVAQVPALRWGIQLGGCSYLLWLAWRLAGTRQLAQARADRLQVGFGQGVLLQFVNIKAWFLALTIIAGWVAGQPNMGLRLGIVVPVMVFFAFSSNLTYACLGAVLRHWLAQGQRLLWFNRGMALLLAVTALWMLQGQTPGFVP
ncbi:LysE family translocator [Comamonas denitrificans]|jgi:threonine/homoserine/homoserine lactone efflux protein|uniref:LysE family translocator n=1 Tax=Comamonas denitrificans TaxID=117506 RepID=A0A939KE77_9BURK|nr:LysE family translocator [Comamonas denitrificans]MBP6259845.1 LysE family translocator [Comamonas sp.]MBO1250114.1 LysE family translocator [Comamonas denitrificans]MBS7243485.1 LysE family translocator [Comamonas sp.]HRL38164.1 LysE family translocator [Comamonas denitrificans]HRL91820.1 LysE family translocator [Comamonas denitrificans]